MAVSFVVFCNSAETSKGKKKMTLRRFTRRMYDMKAESKGALRWRPAT